MMMLNTEKSKKLLRLIVRGWKEFKYPFARNRYYDPSTGGYCALGVAAKMVSPELQLTGNNDTDWPRVRNVLKDHLHTSGLSLCEVASIQNKTKTKNEAMRVLKERYNGN